VIYLSNEQGMEAENGKYLVVCEKHNTNIQTTSLVKARPFLKYPEFCESCMQSFPGKEITK
jgi:hypothetical protein